MWGAAHRDGSDAAPRIAGQTPGRMPWVGDLTGGGSRARPVP